MVHLPWGTPMRPPPEPDLPLPAAPLPQQGISPTSSGPFSGSRCTSSRMPSLKAASTVSVTVVSEPPTRQRRQRAPGAEGRPQPPVLCCRHLPVPDHLVQQLHRLACHLLWLQLRVGSGGGAQGPRISLRPPASSLAFHHLARVGWTCLALWTCGHTIPCPCPRRSSVQWETAVQGLLHYM